MSSAAPLSGTSGTCPRRFLKNVHTRTAAENLQLHVPRSLQEVCRKRTPARQHPRFIVLSSKYFFSPRACGCGSAVSKKKNGDGCVVFFFPCHDSKAKKKHGKRWADHTSRAKGIKRSLAIHQAVLRGGPIAKAYDSPHRQKNKKTYSPSAEYFMV